MARHHSATSRTTNRILDETSDLSEESPQRAGDEMDRGLRYPDGTHMSTIIKRRLFTVRDYHRMGEAGILLEDDRVELIRGEIVAMSPIGNPHNAAIDREGLPRRSHSSSRRVAGSGTTARLSHPD